MHIFCATDKNQSEIFLKRVTAFVEFDFCPGKSWDVLRFCEFLTDVQDCLGK